MLLLEVLIARAFQRTIAVVAVVAVAVVIGIVSWGRTSIVGIVVRVSRVVGLGTTVAHY